MDTDGVGWFMLRLANPSAALAESDWHGVLMSENAASNCWSKCDDDAAMFYQGAVETSPPWVTTSATVGVVPLPETPGGNSDTTWALKYARPDTGAVYTREQMDALRSQVDQLSSTSRIVATTADDDNSVDSDLSSGHEVYVYDSDGVEMLLTPGQDGNCGASNTIENSRTGFRLWATAVGESNVAGDVKGLSEPLGSLPGNFALPTHVRLAVRSGGGCSFGYEQRTILAKPGKEWVPEVTAAYCSHPDISASATCSVYGSTCYKADLGTVDPAATCAAQDTDCVFVADNPSTDVNEARCNPPACSDAVLDGDDAANEAACIAVSVDCRYLTAAAACQAQNEWTHAKNTGECSTAELNALGPDACRATNSWDTATSTCSNTFDSATSCKSPNTWIEPVWRAYCDVNEGGARAATLTCSSPNDSRVSACGNGFYKVPGTDDDPNTAEVDETTPDTCAPNRCAMVAEAELATLGYAAQNPDGTTVPDLGALTCANGFRLTLIASVATAVCSTDGGQFLFEGCVADPDGSPSPTPEDAAPPAPPARTCPDVDNAAHDAMYECDGELTRVSACSTGFFKVVGNSESSDACTSCTAVDNARLTSTSCGLAAIGDNSASNSKTVSLPGQYICPDAVDRESWYGDEVWDDSFMIMQDRTAGTVTATRTDSDGGWSMNLRFACCEPALSCSSELDSRVTDCALGFKKIAGVADDPETLDVDETTHDTCVPSNCVATTAPNIAALGYTASGVLGATTVADLGTIECASGYRLADPEIAAFASCPVADAQFVFAGCVEITCTNSSPEFLQGFQM